MHVPPHELFIVLERFRSRFGELDRALAPLTQAAAEGPLVVGCNAYYRADTDVALLSVRFDARSLSPQKLAWILALIERSQLLVLDPEKLRDDDRRNFYGNYLPQYRVRVEAQEGPAHALGELAHLLALPDAPPRPPTRLPSGTPDHKQPRGVHASHATPRAAPSGRSAATSARSSQRFAAPPAGSASSARGAAIERLEFDPEHDAPLEGHDDGETRRLGGPPPHELRDAGLADPPAPSASDTRGRYSLYRAGQRERIPVREAAGPSAPRRELPPRPLGKRRPERERNPTVPATPTARAERPEARASFARPPEPAALPPPPMTARGTQELPRLGSPSGADLVGYAPALNVRFQRGDDWVPARLRSLNLKGARLATGAPPRLGDHVQVVVGLREVGTVLSGEVVQVVGAREVERDGGSTGFSLSFEHLVGAARAELVELLTQAKDAGIALRPPPPRSAARFPVMWPTEVQAGRRSRELDAIDVSRTGLFLATNDEITTSEIAFRIPLESGEEVCGRGEIARQVSDQMANARGLARGYGVRIVDLAGEDLRQWAGFLERIRQRTERRLLVAARPARADDLARGLRAAGYVVTVGTDPRRLVEQADHDPRPPDAALIDVELAETDPASQRLRRIFNLRHVPCVTVGAEQPDRARTVVDHLLHIA